MSIHVNRIFLYHLFNLTSSRLSSFPLQKIILTHETFDLKIFQERGTPFITQRNEKFKNLSRFKCDDGQTYMHRLVYVAYSPGGRPYTLAGTPCIMGPNLNLTRLIFHQYSKSKRVMEFLRKSISQTARGNIRTLA